jgi:hypothetical protein
LARAWEYLERLSRFEHRGTATSEEAKAADALKSWLAALGYAVVLQPFRTPKDTLYLGPSAVMAGFAVSAAWLGQRWPWAGLLLCLAVLLPMAGEMLGSSRLDFDWLLPTYPSQNVVARRPGVRAAAGRTLVISAHYDTQRASYLFHPAFARYLQPYFTLVYALLALAPVLLVAHWVWPGAGWVATALVADGAALVINIAFLLLCRATGRYINGANDNGSGTALALALAEQLLRRPLPDTDVIVLLTGAEEVGTRGMKHFVRTCGLDTATTRFVNLDNIGGGTLHYLLGEGMLAFRPYGAGLVSLAREMAADAGGLVRAKKNLLLPTDGLIPALAGYESISFLAFADDGSLPNYHWYTDTFANVDRELLAYAEQFLQRYLERLAGNLAHVSIR